MVAMEMRDKHMVETRKFQTHAAHGQLGTFATVNHKQFVSEIDNLA
jgi:hypothetical protein